MSNQECRKFSPNIFNKSKCSNCFRLKEDHSASAIQLNKASRKISKCGYLFVAPDWDFSNPINRCLLVQELCLWILDIYSYIV